MSNFLVNLLIYYIYLPVGGLAKIANFWNFQISIFGPRGCQFWVLEFSLKISKPRPEKFKRVRPSKRHVKIKPSMGKRIRSIDDSIVTHTIPPVSAKRSEGVGSTIAQCRVELGPKVLDMTQSYFYFNGNACAICNMHHSA